MMMDKDRFQIWDRALKTISWSCTELYDLTMCMYIKRKTTSLVFALSKMACQSDAIQNATWSNGNMRSRIDMVLWWWGSWKFNVNCKVVLLGWYLNLILSFWV